MKKGKIVVSVCIIYFISALAIYCGNMNIKGANDNIVSEDEIKNGTELPVIEQPENVANDIRENFITQHLLPSLERMEQADQDQYVNQLKVIEKINRLELNTNDMLCPDVGIANIEASIKKMEAYQQGETVVFNGITSQELQQMIDRYPNAVIDIVTEQIEMTSAIVLHDNIVINGNGVRINAQGVEYGFFAEKAENICITNVFIDGVAGYGIYCVDCNYIEITNNVINGCEQKAINITGAADGVIISNNKMSDNQLGAVCISGNVSDGLIESNTVINNGIDAAESAGIVLASIVEKYPHNFIIRNNKIIDNKSIGIYSEGAYMCYVLDNMIGGNDSGGISLCKRTLGFYLSNNAIESNGARTKNNSLEAKMPGIFLDNTAYSILTNNNLSNNYGGGIQMVRTAVRNVVIDNVITNNNATQNDGVGFYGIALRSDFSENENGKMGYTPNYENIICRNIVSGNYCAGIFIDKECYINDVFDNVVMDSRNFGIEVISLKFNSIANNITNCGVYNEFK